MPNEEVKITQISNNNTDEKIKELQKSYDYLYAKYVELRDIIDGGIEYINIQKDTIKGHNIEPQTITNEEIEDAAIISSKIASAAVTAIKIATSAIDATKFADTIKPIEVVDTLPEAGTQGRTVFLTTDNKLYRDTGTAWTTVIPTTDLTGTITETQIANNAITTDKINANAVTAAKIAANTITASQIAANTIEAGQIKAGAIGTDQLAALAVTAAKIAANTITANKIYAGAIGADQLAANAVTADKINASAVTTVKLDALAVTAAKIATGTITANKYNELRNTYVFNGDDSLDATFPFELDFEIVSEMTAINKVLLSFRISQFRAYSKAGVAAGTPSGGGDTSGAGGSFTKTSGVESGTSAAIQHIDYDGGGHITGIDMVEVGKLNHTHTITVLNHTHSTPAHTHPNHTHTAVYGIFEDSQSPTIHYYIDNGAGYGEASGAFTTDQLDIDITASISGVGFKRIKFDSDVRCRIRAWVLCKVDITA